MLWHFLSFLKGVKDAFVAPEGRRDFCQDATVAKSLIFELRENLPFVSSWSGNVVFLARYVGDLRTHCVA